VWHLIRWRGPWLVRVLLVLRKSQDPLGACLLGTHAQLDLRCTRASGACARGAVRASHCIKGSTCAGRALACAKALGAIARGMAAWWPPSACFLAFSPAPRWLRGARHSQHPLLLHKPSPDPQAGNRGLAPAARPAPAAWLPCWPAAPARRRAGRGLRGPA